MNSMNKVIAFLFAIAVSLSGFSALADECCGTVRGRIVSAGNEPVEGAYIYVIVTSPEEKVIATSFSDENGAFEMTSGCGDELYLIISCLGYNQFVNKYSLGQNEVKDLGDCRLEINAKELQTVVVKGRPLTVKSLPDGFSVDVRKLAESSNNAFDLLGRLPQIIVEGDKITVVGKEKILVRVNNVLQRVEAADLPNVLRGYDAELIDRVDVITSPPLKYDSEGTTAMITLHMNSKFNKYAGGNIGFEFMKNSGYGGREAVYGSGIFNNKKLFVDITPSFNHNFSHYKEDALYTYEDNTTYKNYTLGKGRDNYVGSSLTAQYQYDKGYVGLNANINKRTTHNKFPSEETLLDVRNLNRNDIDIDKPRFNATMYAEHAFTNEFKWWLDVIYYNFREDTGNFFDGIYENSESPFMAYDSMEKLKINGVAFCNDYSIDIGKEHKHTLDFGIKFFYSHLSNGKDAELALWPEGILSRQNDILKLNETKTIPYLSYTWRPADRLSFRIGSQYMYTVRQVKNLNMDKTKIEYSSYLPDFLASWKPADSSRLSFIITSGSTEPNFSRLNPFEWRTGQYSYAKGNLSLRSENRYLYKLVYVYKDIFTVTCYLNQKRNVISSINTVVDNNIYSTQKNAQNSIDYGIMPTYYFNRLWWLTLSAGIYGGYEISKGIIPEVPKRETSYQWGGNFNSSFIFNRQRTFTGDFGFNYKGRTRNVVTTVEPTYSFYAGLSLYLLDRKMGIHISGLNLFASAYKGTSHAAGYVMEFNNRYNYPTLYFHITYRINNINDDAKNRTEAIRNVQQRL